MPNRRWIPIGLGLGANLGDAPAAISNALRTLEDRGHVRIDRISSLYRTKPWGPVSQPDFANACALGETNLSPRELLNEIKLVETQLGRVTSERWGPRAIDIDILFYEDASLDTPDLVIPHESLFERAFVLVPLAEIAPNLIIGGKSVRDAARAIDGAEVVRWFQAQHQADHGTST
jgi:2-amino-4-hydroxy-6-hydroxymethyldihydropteridine diphosphokinase